MARVNKKPQLIEFKGTTLPVVSVTLHSLQSGPLAKAASELFGDDAFFDGDAAVLELDRIDMTNVADAVEWSALRNMFNRHGLNVIGVRGGSDALRASAGAAGLPSFAAFKRSARGPLLCELFRRLVTFRPESTPAGFSWLIRAIH